MDPDPRTPRKVKFSPKPPPRRTPKPTTTTTTTQIDDDDGDYDAEDQLRLSRKVREHLSRRGTKVQKKPSAQVAFSHASASTGIRTYGKQKERTEDKSRASEAEGSHVDEKQSLDTTPESTFGTEELEENPTALTDALVVKKKKEYTEPWDYENSYYPTTLPLRRPYSGDPEVLDKEEFEEDVEYDENTLSSARDLGLLDEEDEPRMFFFQFPPNLPLGGQPNRRETANNSQTVDKLVEKQKEIVSSSSKGKEKVGTVPKVSGTTAAATNPSSGHPSRKNCSLEELPEGYMGKMLVYKSGAVKLKLGDILFDVSPGSDYSSPQDVMTIDTTNRQCSRLGELNNKRAVVSPNIDSMLDDMS